VADKLRGLCAELVCTWNRSTSLEDLFKDMNSLVARVSKALAEPEPPNVRTVLERLVELEDGKGPAPAIANAWTDAIAAARAALADPEPPADGEVAELVEFLRDGSSRTVKNYPSESTKLTRAADLLERLAEPEPPANGEMEMLARLLREENAEFTDGGLLGHLTSAERLRVADHLDRLAEPEPVGPSDEDIDRVLSRALHEYMNNQSPFGGPTDNKQLDRAKARAVLARWGRP
jgi:hypothetical protein